MFGFVYIIPDPNCPIVQKLSWRMHVSLMSLTKDMPV